ncbi:MAG TPA: DinB family protein, partial [Miltoncostaeaceae bacterium]|nr:DinB family protein [Miltoncostaeaceae bacterium]
MGRAAEAIAQSMGAVRERTLDLFAPLDHERLHRSPDPIMSPPVWDLGHIAAYEELWLVERLGGRPSLYPELQGAYDAFETPRAERGDVELLDAAGALDYLARVRERSLASLAAADLGPDGPELVAGGFVFEMVLAHEAQHTETVLQSLQMMPSGAYRPAARREVPEAVACPKARIEVPGGEFWMGAGPDRFAYDCERPRHRRSLRPFAV